MKHTTRRTILDRIVTHLSRDEDARVSALINRGTIYASRTPEGHVALDLDLNRSEKHQFIFTSAGGDVLFSCTCPYFERTGQPCAHLGIVVVQAMQAGVLSPSGVLITKEVLDLPEAPAPFVPTKWGLLPVQGPPRTLTPAQASQISGQIQVPRFAWKPLFETIRRTDAIVDQRLDDRWPADRQILYAIDVPQTLQGRGIVVRTFTREPKKDGNWKKPSAVSTSTEMLVKVHDEQDRQILALMSGASSGTGYGYYSYNGALQRILTEAHAAALMPMLCKTGRLYLHFNEQDRFEESTPLHWDDLGTWRLWLDVRRQATGDYFIQGSIRRGEGDSVQEMPIDAPVMLTSRGHVFTKDGRVAPFDDSGAFGWVVALRKKNAILVPADEGEELLAELYAAPRLPKLQLPEQLAVKHDPRPMRPSLVVRKGKSARAYYADSTVAVLIGDLSFNYGDTNVAATTSSPGVYDRKARVFVPRDPIAEASAIRRLHRAGFRDVFDHSAGRTLAQIAPKALPSAIRGLLNEGWHVEAEGKLYRTAGNFTLDVTSGIDWFDLNIKADFGGVSASLPRLLAALRRGESLVQLDDGTFGLVPEEWLKKYAPFTGVGEESGNSLRFKRTQVGILDALLAAQPQATFDEAFRHTRDELRNFAGIAPQNPPQTFIGQLRPYQRDALGWFDFLRRFSFGGCLADDMGLGKTVQVLALLDSRRQNPAKPSLVVVPRSLIFNWAQEAAKFAPKLRVLDHSAPSRVKGADHFTDYDLVLTTYGTLRKDAPYLKDIHFDYAIIDEAQAIKNAASESAKAVRLIQADHRLALSGTPVQNHLGDLWSLFDFLNPGMLGSVSAFSGSALIKAPDDANRQLLSRGLRPFILRRTKEQVATELPSRVEQTVYCELEPAQRALYNELREHYRASLLKRIETDGIGKAKIQILEALLRLRQAAIHPALIDKKYANDSSAKLDLLLPQLSEITQDGHKALVFSQFTGMLSLVKKRLDADKIPYEYLDGKTKDRQARVEHFQSNSDCRLFLISLKAGGVGLNLTAADYVFLLDPWWNPSVEAQAIDRTHRIGQDKQVFAYRLIARNTVEEKVLALQQTKRALADAIINADNSLIRTIGKEDIELLLS